MRCAGCSQVHSGPRERRRPIMSVSQSSSSYDERLKHVPHISDDRVLIKKSRLVTGTQEVAFPFKGHT
jgi:hypothetical protein